MADLAELETELRGLLRGKHASLTLSFNESNAPNYMTVEDFDREGPYKYGWTSDEERQRAIENNAVWELQWYPDTPIGSYSVAASSLPALIAAVREHSNG